MRTRFFVGVLLTFATTLTSLATLAVADSRKSTAKPPRPPTGVKADAQSPFDEAAVVVDASTSVGSPAESPSAPLAPFALDGGVRDSKLTPSPEEFSATRADAGAPVDYDRLLADVAALRARVAAVSDTFYQSRVVVTLQSEGSHATITRLTLSLDDGVVFAAPVTFAMSDRTIVYDHAVAPGRHTVTVDVDRKDYRDDSFTTAQRNRFTIDVPRDHRVEAQVRLLDDSTMGKEFRADKTGEYDLRFRVNVAAKKVSK